MTISQTQLVGVVGGSIGDDPFNRRTWSGSSYFLFTEMQRQGLLARAVGAKLHRVERYAFYAKNFHRDRAVWRRRFYLDSGYRKALSRAAGRAIGPVSSGQGLLQIGALFNLGRVAPAGVPRFSYHDGNLAVALRSGTFTSQLSKRRIDAALAWERETSAQMTCVLTMSEYLRQSFIDDLGVPPHRVVTIGGGMNLETLPEPAVDKRYDTEQILFIGIEFERKGGWHLLRAFREVRARRPQARLHIVGPRSLVVPPDLEGGVTVHGFLDKKTEHGRAVLRKLFAEASLFVLPSLYEPFGIAPLEAMVHEIPCIVTDAWALREMVTPGHNGELVAAGDESDLASKIATHLADPSTLQRWGAAGRARALERYTWKSVVERLRNAVEEATQR